MREEVKLYLSFMRLAIRNDIDIAFISLITALMREAFKIAPNEATEIAEILKADIRERHAQQPYFMELCQQLSYMTLDNPFGQGGPYAQDIQDNECW